MDAEVKTRWLEALRSGEYEQTMHKLKKNGGYCCLGVLCEIAVTDGLIAKNEEFEDDVRFIDPQDQYDYSTTVLPYRVFTWAGVGMDNPEVGLVKEDVPARLLPEYNDHFYASNKIFQTLADLNDHGWTFAEIADVIEKYL